MLLIATQNNVTRTNYIKAKKKKKKKKKKKTTKICNRIASVETDVTVIHKCSKLAQKMYKARQGGKGDLLEIERENKI